MHLPGHTQQGLEGVGQQCARPLTASSRAQLDQLHSDLLIGPAEGSRRPVTRSQRPQVGVSVLGGTRSPSPLSRPQSSRSIRRSSGSVPAQCLDQQQHQFRFLFQLRFPCHNHHLMQLAQPQVDALLFRTVWHKTPLAMTAYFAILSEKNWRCFHKIERG